MKKKLLNILPYGAALSSDEKIKELERRMAHLDGTHSNWFNRWRARRIIKKWRKQYWKEAP